LPCAPFFISDRTTHELSKTWRGLSAAVVIAAVAGCGTSQTGPAANAATATTQTVKVQQVRNATIKVEYAGTTFLIDPMLAPKETYPGFPGTYNSHLRNPLVDLPMPATEAIKADAVVVTHTQSDHWDDAAKQGLPKGTPVFAQDEADASSIRKDGFTNVRLLTQSTEFNGTRRTRTGGQHGDDKAIAVAGEVLGKVSGVVFQRLGYKTVYVAGDTVWNAHVETAIRQYRPDVIVLNTGYARVTGLDGSIIMGK
jgi:L-ascorbate metabolism protein UlaG (beta-lactamase superfamily)